MELLKEGDIIELGADHTVYAMIPKHFVYSNRRGDWSLTHHETKLDGDFAHMQGRYIVTRVAQEGGGTGHGPNDVFPDGHHVFCRHVETGNEVDFYQSGCFTAMIRDIKPVGRAECRWMEVGE